MRLAVVFIAILWLAGCVTTTSDYTLMRNDLNQVMLTQAELKRQIRSIQKTLAGYETNRNNQQVLEALRQSQMSLREELDALRADLQALQAAVDDNTYKLQRKLQESRTQEQDLQNRIEQLREEIDAIKLSLSELKDSIEALQASVQQPPEQPAARTPEEFYKSALDTLQQGNTQQAREQFEEFIKRFPKSELADNAQFWIAESYYKEGNYEEAILSYEKLIREYPDSNKIPDAMLKQALAFEKLGDTNTTRVILKSIVEKFPEAEASRKAKDILERLKKKS